MIEKTQGKKNILLFILIGAFLFGGAFFFIKFFNESKVFTAPSTSFQLPVVNIDFEVLKNPIFEELEVLEEAPLPEEKGRENPFLPYSPSSELIEEIE